MGGHRPRFGRVDRDRDLRGHGRRRHVEVMHVHHQAVLAHERISHAGAVLDGVVGLLREIGERVELEPRVRARLEGGGRVPSRAGRHVEQEEVVRAHAHGADHLHEVDVFSERVSELLAHVDFGVRSNGERIHREGHRCPELAVRDARVAQDDPGSAVGAAARRVARGARRRGSRAARVRRRGRARVVVPKADRASVLAGSVGQQSRVGPCAAGRQRDHEGRAGPSSNRHRSLHERLVGQRRRHDRRAAHGSSPSRFVDGFRPRCPRARSQMNDANMRADCASGSIGGYPVRASRAGRAGATTARRPPILHLPCTGSHDGPVVCSRAMPDGAPDGTIECCPGVPGGT